MVWMLALPKYPCSNLSPKVMISGGGGVPGRWSLMNEISKMNIFINNPKNVCSPPLSSEDRKWPQQKLNLQVHWSWTSHPLEIKEIASFWLKATQSLEFCIADEDKDTGFNIILDIWTTQCSLPLLPAPRYAEKASGDHVLRRTLGYCPPVFPLLYCPSSGVGTRPGTYFNQWQAQHFGGDSGSL